MNTPAFAPNWSSFEPPPPKETDNSASEESDLAPLDSRRIDLATPPAKPVPVFMLNSQQVSTSGNLMAITAQAKAGKSAVVGAMLAAVMVTFKESQFSDCLGFQSHPHNGKAVILFDTEQTPYDSHRLVKRAADRADVSVLPGNFRLYRLLDISTQQRRAYLAAEMERASKVCGGIHSVFVDGVADLCVDPNDSADAFGLVDDLVQLAVKHDCPIIVVLHENPSQQPGSAKTRGHLGSQLERKAESNLRILKEGDTSVIFSEKCRSANIPKDRGVRFAWSDLEVMHITVELDVAADCEAKKKEEQRPVCEAVFEGVSGPLAWKELRERTEQNGGVKGRTAERRIKLWQDLGLVTKDEKGYHRA